jgi:hypothetical protein
VRGRQLHELGVAGGAAARVRDAVGGQVRFGVAHDVDDTSNPRLVVNAFDELSDAHPVGVARLAS